ncbi:hypothetical protein, partial [Calidithermus chliarophilus]|uniref:hypothetical protein n=1 Tax=Calidithermus chliarophilus TaxID=52023 RepID=UPI00048650B4
MDSVELRLRMLIESMGGEDAARQLGLVSEEMRDFLETMDQVGEARMTRFAQSIQEMAQQLGVGVADIARSTERLQEAWNRGEPPAPAPGPAPTPAP